MRMVRKKPQNGGPESGTKTDVVSRVAFVKKVLEYLLLIIGTEVRTTPPEFGRMGPNKHPKKSGKLVCFCR